LASVVSAAGIISACPKNGCSRASACATGPPCTRAIRLITTVSMITPPTQTMAAATCTNSSRLYAVMSPPSALERSRPGMPPGRVLHCRQPSAARPPAVRVEDRGSGRRVIYTGCLYTLSRQRIYEADETEGKAAGSRRPGGCRHPDPHPRGGPRPRDRGRLPALLRGQGRRARGRLSHDGLLPVRHPRRAVQGALRPHGRPGPARPPARCLRAARPARRAREVHRRLLRLLGDGPG